MEFLLPPELIFEVLSRLNDSTEIARCRTVSKIFNSLANEIKSVHLQYTHDRHLKAETRSETVTPFKKMFFKSISSAKEIEFVKIGVDNPRSDYQSEFDDLFLTHENFLILWLPKVCKSVKSISITDYWDQSSKKKSDALSLISSQCENLMNLEMKNAKLSVQNLNPMLNLASLTLEFIRLEDNLLFDINTCFPNLQSLSLVEVSRFKDSKIHLLNLRKLHWKIITAPSTVTIIAPNLSELVLECPFMLKKLAIESPLVSHFKLVIQDAAEYSVKALTDMKSLHIESTNIFNTFSSITFGTNIQTLTVDSSNITDITLLDMVDMFPNMTSLTLGSGFWSELEKGPFPKDGMKKLKGLKEFGAHIVLHDTNSTVSLIYGILDLVPSLLRVSIYVHHDVEKCEANSLVSRCVARMSTVEWRWGLWGT